VGKRRTTDSDDQCVHRSLAMPERPDCRVQGSTPVLQVHTCGYAQSLWDGTDPLIAESMKDAIFLICAGIYDTTTQYQERRGQLQTYSIVRRWRHGRRLTSTGPSAGYAPTVRARPPPDAQTLCSATCGPILASTTLAGCRLRTEGDSASRRPLRGAAMGDRHTTCRRPAGASSAEQRLPASLGEPRGRAGIDPARRRHVRISSAGGRIDHVVRVDS